MKRALFEYVASLGKEKSSGCLQLIPKDTSEKRIVSVFLMEGEIRHCEMRGPFEATYGVHHFIRALHWPELESWWIEGRTPPRESFRMDLTTWLERLEMLEFHRPEEISKLLEAIQPGPPILYGVTDISSCAVSLFITNTDLQGKEYFSHQQEVLIGRSPQCDMVVSLPFVSARHCKLTIRPQGILLEDLGSTHGTRVNDVEVRRTKLLPGDRISMGNVTLELRVSPWSEVKSDNVLVTRTGLVNEGVPVELKEGCSTTKLLPASQKPEKKLTGKVFLDAFRRGLRKKQNQLVE